MAHLGPPCTSRCSIGRERINLRWELGAVKWNICLVFSFVPHKKRNALDYNGSLVFSSSLLLNCRLSIDPLCASVFFYKGRLLLFAAGSWINCFIAPFSVRFKRNGVPYEKLLTTTGQRGGVEWVEEAAG